MFINEVVDNMTDEQYKEFLDSCTPMEKIFMGIARDGGARIYTSEMAPKGYTFRKEADDERTQNDPSHRRLE